MVEAARKHAFIVGAAKCGTNTLFELLGRHPNVCACSEKEPSFFTFPELYEKGLEWYLGLWDFDPALHKVAVEASVTYAEDPNRPCAAPFIKEYFPDARIMYIVRDPLKRIESHYNFLRATDNPGSSAPITADFYIDGSRYFHQYELYSRHFDREQIRVLDFRMLRDDQKKLMRQVCSFLGLPANAASNSGDAVHAWSTDDLMLRKKFVDLAGPLACMLHVFPYSLRQLVKEKLAWYSRNQRVQLDEVQTEYLRERLKEDREQFISEFGWYPEERGRRKEVRGKG